MSGFWKHISLSTSQHFKEAFVEEHVLNLIKAEQCPEEARHNWIGLNNAGCWGEDGDGHGMDQQSAD